MKDSEESYQGKETFDVYERLLREKGVDLIGVDPKLLSFKGRLRQKKQLQNYDGSPIIRKAEPEPEKIIAYIPEEPTYEESKGPLTISETSDQNNTVAPIPLANIRHHFPSLEREMHEMMADLNSPEEEYIPDPQLELPLKAPINVLSSKKRAIRLPADSTELTRKKRGKKPGKSRAYKRVEPVPIPEGYEQLKNVVPPEDYHAIRQSPRYSHLLLRQDKRVLVKTEDREKILELRNGKSSSAELTPEHQLLHTFADTKEDKTALQEAASHGRIAAIRKKDGWYATSEVAKAYLETRHPLSSSDRPMTHTEVMRYRDLIAKGIFPARKIRNRWHTSDEEIREFERQNPSKRKIEI